MATTTSPGTSRARATRWAEVAVLAVLAYLPAVRSAPGQVSADSKQYLYLDPADFLARAPYLWDARAGAGGVSHQHIGYLWPMGPWFWALDAIGVPTWVAQRLWLGTLALVAALGTRWLLGRLGLSRVGVLVGTLVYVLTPYQLAFSARSSVLLLPWAGLPWLVGLTDRAQREGGWRDPAWIALIVLTVGAVNASSLVLVAVGPLVWLLVGVTSRVEARRAVGVAGRVALLSLGVSLWWIAGLRLEGAYGLPVLQVTENLESVAATSTPSDVLRGLGNWFFYGRDRLGYSIDQAEHYVRDLGTVLVTFTLAAVGVAAGVLVRWRHRARFVALVLVGTVVSVGAWPLDDPSPFAHAVAELTDTSVGLALRNTARAVPILVLGLAGLVGAAVSACRPRPLRWGAAALACLLAVGGLRPVASLGLLSEHQQRDDPVPAYWTEVAAALEGVGTDTRVLELPGSNFSAFRWGNAVDPILPGLMERGHLGREVLPLGSASSVLLIDALDRRLQEGTLEPAAVAAIARLFAAGEVVVRSDLEYERFRTPNPRALWEQLTARDLPGLEDPVAYGPPVRNQPTPSLPMLDEIELRTDPDAPDPPPVSTFAVESPASIVRVAPTTAPVVLAGDGDGIVDAAAAGLVDGRALVLQATSLSEGALTDALAAGGDLVVTDTYRRRIQTWFYAIRDTRGPTERAGETLVEPSGYDHRIDPTPEVGDDDRTVVEQVGGQVEATLGGGADRPEDRAASAVDGDPRTAWRVGGADPAGTRLRVTIPAGVATDELTLVQPQDGPRDRAVTDVRVWIDDRPAFDVALTEASTTPAGQTVPLPVSEVHELEIELLGVSTPPFDPELANAVGFAEVRLGDLVVEEWVRVPTGLVERAEDGEGHRLDLVLSRLRYEPGARGRVDQERALRRVFDLPAERAFALAGTLRVDPNAPDDVIDAVIGTALDGAVVTASSHLAGDLDSRASRVLDGDLTTSWQAAFGPQDAQHVTLRLAEPRTVRDLEAVVLADGRHSVPGTLTLVADGTPVGSVGVPPSPDGSPVAVALPDPPPGSRELRIEVADVAEVTPVPGDPSAGEILPVGIAEITGAGLPRAADPAVVDGRCRSLLRVDGAEVSVRAVGATGDARAGLALEPCDGPLTLAAGAHTIASARGVDTGWDVDRVVLSSDAEGLPAPLAARGTPRADAGTTVEVERDHRGTEYDLALTTDGEPFWLVLGQSDNRGWSLDVDGATVGPRQVVDGYANGWLVTPEGPGELHAAVQWEPQRLVWVTLGLSALAVLACIVLVVRHRRRRIDPGAAPSPLAPPPTLAAAAPGRRPLTPGTPGLAVALGLGALLVATPAAAVTVSVAVVVGLAVPRATWAWALVAPALVLTARGLEHPELAWLALALLASDLAVEQWTRRSVSSRGRSDRRAAPAR
jgi:arabinofuranan 3-O-arabinosyltransferase